MRERFPLFVLVLSLAACGSNPSTPAAAVDAGDPCTRMCRAANAVCAGGGAVPAGAQAQCETACRDWANAYPACNASRDAYLGCAASAAPVCTGGEPTWPACSATRQTFSACRASASETDGGVPAADVVTPAADVVTPADDVVTPAEDRPTATDAPENVAETVLRCAAVCARQRAAMCAVFDDAACDTQCRRPVALAASVCRSELQARADCWAEATWTCSETSGEPLAQGCAREESAALDCAFRNADAGM